MMRYVTSLLVIATLGVGYTTMAPATESLSASIEIESELVAAAAASQRRVDRVHEEAQTLLAEYSALASELHSLRRYNDHLEQMVGRQQEAYAERENQLAEIDITHRDILPLMSRMVESLSRFIDLDVPFLLTERRLRVDRLRAMMDSPDISVAEKYRRVLEAYRIETEYGRSVEAYRGSLEIHSRPHTVEFLRAGRVVFIYRTLDGSKAGAWDPAVASWIELADGDRMALTKAFRVARKQAAPDLLQLPVPAPVPSP